MNSGHTTGSAHCKDANGNTVIVTITRGGHDGETTIEVTQFKGADIEWNKSLSIEDLVRFIKYR